VTTFAVIRSCCAASGLHSIDSTTLPRAIAVAKLTKRNAILPNLITPVLDRIICTILLENCLQVHIQSTFYTLNVAVAKMRNQKVGMQLALISSIVCTICSSVLKLLELGRVYSALPIAAEIADEVPSHENTNACSTLQKKSRYVTFGFACVIFSICSSVLKCLMAHVCSEAVWTLNGCMNTQQVR